MHRVAVLRVLLAASILSTAVHYTHNFIAVSDYPGPSSLYTPTRVAIVLAWPLLTWIGLIGYRRYTEGRMQEAFVALVTYSITGISTPGHFLFGDPHIPAPFFATLFTDALTGLAILAFALIAVRPRREAV